MIDQFVRRSPSRRTRATFALGALALSACAPGQQGSFPADTVARPATDLPRAFTFTVPPAGEACRSPAVDPRDGIRLTLVRSTGGRGDYETPEGRYGVRSGEYLRLTCATGEVVGVVPR